MTPQSPRIFSTVFAAELHEMAIRIGAKLFRQSF